MYDVKSVCYMDTFLHISYVKKCPVCLVVFIALLNLLETVVKLFISYIYLQDKSDRPEMGKSERSITDKKRERRRKKKYQHVNREKLQKIKERKNRLKKTSSADIQAIKSSNKFFAQLTETVQSHVQQKKDLMNEQRTDKNKKKLLHLKL